MSPPPSDLAYLISTKLDALSSIPEANSKPSPNPRLSSLYRYIDHTLLKLDATEAQVTSLCQEALKYHFLAVCVRLDWVALCTQHLKDSDVSVACVIDFHHGTATASQKFQEAQLAVEAGARELDLVIDYPALKRGDFDIVYEGIAAVRAAADTAYPSHGDGPGNNRKVIVKTILETSQLSRNEIIAACVIADHAGADFVKTSTGFNGPGASVENVRLMKCVVGDKLKVKASGGVRTVGDCVKMIEAGAERIGTSNGVGIIQEIESM